MKKFKLLDYKHIFFVGIGGISMSGLAKMCYYMGIKVSGSDMVENAEVQKLKSAGIKINIGHSARNIDKSIDLLVFTGAVHSDNIELQTAKKLKIKCIERSKLLGQISQIFEQVIAISGTHGKTSTTAMIGWILECAGYNPTIHLGGESINFCDNTYIGSNKYLVLEACEYRESFKYLKPNVAVVTNIELDHVDYYKDYKAIFRAFIKFVSNAQTIVTIPDTDLKHSNSVIIGRDFEIKKLQFVDCGYNFVIYKHGSFYGEFRINLLGEHNVSNALYAIATADYLGIGVEKIKFSLNSYLGVKRRYEVIGEYATKKVIIDYAHHPTEIAKSLSGIRKVYERILVVFQPHTFSRTLKLFDNFVDVLKDIEQLILYTTYPARESEIIGGRAEDLADALNLLCVNSIEDLEKIIEKNIDSCDCVLVLGAGDLAEKIKTLPNLKKN